jgi:predicted O-methyltransferase YrrM
MNSIIIDSTECMSDLCSICAESRTDKSPYALQGKHRHPYTTPYSLLFEPLRNKAIKFAEIGIAEGNSLAAWSNYFTKARLYGFDRGEEFLDHSRERFPNITLDKMDASKGEDIYSALQKHTADGELFDVIIDDASHEPEHQQQVILTAFEFLKSGGMLIIEDIFRERPITPYEEVFEKVKHMVSFHTFIVCEHKNRFSPEWNNDKLLLFIKV